MGRLALAASCLGLLMLRLAPGSAASQAAGSGFTLATIDVVGIKRYAAADVIKVAGLNTGQKIAPTDLDAVAQALANTGLFAKVAYRYVTKGTQLALTLDVQEETWTMPVVFDNFVWFGDAELTAAVRQTVPSFDGTVPANDGITNFLSRELQRLLDGRRIAGRIEFAPHVDLASGAKRFIFSVKDAGPALKICSLRIDGAAAVSEAELQQAADLTGTEYSRTFTTGLANGTLRQIYRKRGFWKADFAAPEATPDAGGGCGGVAVTLRVSEGVAYSWDRAEWTGHASLAAKDLDAALRMKPGEVADVSKIEAGLRVVHGAYERIGFMLQSATLAPQLDDGARRAAFTIAVREGPQFHMGTLEFVGLAPNEEASLRKKWRLQPGDVYDGSYLQRFVADDVGALLGRAQASRGVKPEVRLDSNARKVDVRITVGVRRQ